MLRVKGGSGSVAERQVLRDAVYVGRIDRAGAAQAAAALRRLALAQMPPTSAGAQNLAARRDFEPLRGGLLSFDAFWTSHKSTQLSSKRARNIISPPRGIKRQIHFFDKGPKGAKSEVSSKHPNSRQKHETHENKVSFRVFCISWFPLQALRAVPGNATPLDTRGERWEIWQQLLPAGGTSPASSG
jgi:hypothetical protein